MASRMNTLTHPPLIVGANVRGWWQTCGESTTAAQSRIIGTFGGTAGTLPGFRDWPGSTTWTWADRLARYPGSPHLIVDFPVANMLSPTATELADFKRLCQSAPTDRVHWIAPGHEWDIKSKHGIDATNLPAFLTGLAQFTAIHRQYAPPTLRSTLILCGVTFQSNRLSWCQGGNAAPALAWFAGADVDDVGADVYQQVDHAVNGQPNTGTPDTAAQSFQPVLDVARATNKGVVIPEMGVFANEQYHDYNAACCGITDAAMATWVGDSFAFMRKHPRFRAAMLFEADGWPNPSCVTAPIGRAGGDAAWAPQALGVVQTAIATSLTAGT